MICAACDRNAPEVFPFPSVLDFRNRFVCGSCVDHQAEPASVVQLITESFVMISPEIREAVHVYHDGKYLTVEQWLDRKPASDLEPTVDPVLDDEDERILDEIIRMRPRLDEPLFDRRARHRWGSFLGLFMQFRRAQA